MSKTKIAIMDDSQPSVEGKSKKSKGKNTNENSKLSAEPQRSQTVSGADEKSLKPEQVSSEAGDGEESSSAHDRSEETSEDIRRETELAGPASESKESKTKKEKKSKASAKKGKAKYRSVKYKEAAEKAEKSKRYAVSEAIDLAKSTSYSKFDGSLELHLSTNAKNIRGLVSLPFASGKKLTILAFGKGAEDSGADIVGDDAKLNEIIRGVTGFDVIVTTAEWMPKLARAAKVLGPRGLMPSPKNGTITEDLKKAVTEIQSGKVEYKTQKDSQVIHLTIGKVSQETDQVMQNTKILFNAIGKTRIKKAVISPSMGMGVKLDLASI